MSAEMQAAENENDLLKVFLIVGILTLIAIALSKSST